jgi:gas vesicle protein GvpO
VADDQEPRRRTHRKTDAEEPPCSRRNGSAAVAARRAAQHVADLTGRSPECVISIDGTDDGWKVGVEIVEIRRIPETQDVLAIYEVQVGGNGDLRSYRRIRRYARGQLDRRCQ